MKILWTILRAPVSVRTWRELAYLALSLVPAVAAFCLAVLGIVSLGLSAIGVGLPLLAVVLFAALCATACFRPLARRLLGWEWPSVARLVEAGGMRRALALFRTREAWGSLLYCLAKFPLTITALYLGLIGVVTGVCAITYPVWWFVSPDGFGVIGHNSWPRAWFYALQGLLVVLVFPWLVRLAVLTERAIVFNLVVPNDDKERIAVLRRSREDMADDALRVLRRIERDLHDGTQARLVSLGMMASRLESKAGDPAVRELALSMRSMVEETTAELREIIRGVHPPALDDGLNTALATLASQCGVPTRFIFEVTTQLSDALSTTLYFATAELLTNVARHANADTVEVRVTETPSSLLLRVSDDGVGGVPAVSNGTGLNGLRRRISAFDGVLRISSPAGGPTVVEIEIPKERS